MISGVLPKFQQRNHVLACGFMCLMFTGIFALAGTLFVAGLIGIGPNPGAGVVGVVIMGPAFCIIVSLIRGLKTQVREYTYDSRQLRFRTIADSRQHVRDLADIAEVREGHSPRGSTCYVLSFRHGQKVYLDYALPNVAILVAQMRYDAERLQSRDCAHP